MKTIANAALGAAVSFVLGGCATVINGTSQDVKFQSDPGGAQVKVSGGQSCSTPCEISLKRRHDLRADFTKPGYKPAYVLIRSKTGGAMAGNILLGGLIGGAVDASNGASNHLEPSPVHLKLAAEGSSEGAMLIDDKGKTTALAAHNDEVRADVAETIGVEAAGIETPAIAVSAAAPAAAAPAAAAPAAAAPAAAAPAAIEAAPAEPAAAAPATGGN